jgi:DNA polymerase-3 subunit gamma/tau
MLSSSAFNAFLKTLEEPPPHAIFILATTEKHKIIPTILSRCQIFDFNRIKTEDIINRLRFVAEKESVKCEEEALHVIAIKADGALRDALSIFDQIISFSNGDVKYKDVIDNLNLLDYEYYFRIVDSSLAGNSSQSLIIFNEVLENGFDGHNFIAGLGSHLRDLLVSKDEVTLSLLDTAPAIRDKYREQSSRCSVRFLFRALEACNSCDLSYKVSKNPRLLVEIALLRLALMNDEAADTQPEEKKKLSPDLKAKPAAEPEKIDIVSEPSKPLSNGTDKNTPQNPTVKGGANTVSVRDMISKGANQGSEIASSSSGKNAGVPPQNISREFSEQALREVWLEFAGNLRQESPRISGQLESHLPQISENNSVLIRLSNAALKEEFDKKYKTGLSMFLADIFKPAVFEIISGVEEAENEDPVYYTDEQKYARLASKNPALKDLRRTFNLDFE